MTYVENVRAPWWMWGLALVAALSVGVAVGAAFGGASDLISGAITFGIIGYLLITSTLRIRVDENQLIVGPAHLPRDFVGDVKALDAASARLIRGRDADPAAFMALRGWVSTAVIVTNTDSDDPVPYWFISTRHPKALVSALTSGEPSAR